MNGEQAEMEGAELSWDLDAAIAAMAQALNGSIRSVAAAVELLESGNTIPFIARYRKEATQGLDEIQLRQIEDELARLKELFQRKQTILKTIAEQGLLTPELRQAIQACDDKKQLEDLYLPYKPKRRTKATIAREQGLLPLAELLLEQQRGRVSRHEVLTPFVSAERGVASPEAALEGACAIVAERWAESAEIRDWLREQAWTYGLIYSVVKRGKKEAGSKFEQYFDHQEKVSRIPSHRFLAMRRGENDGVLRVGVQVDDEYVLRHLRRQWLRNRDFEFASELQATVEDCYARLLWPSMESEILQQCKERADEEAIQVFAKNLKELLLAPPAGPHVTMGIDPGFRTGCKVAVVDETGKFLEHCTIYPTAPKNDVRGAREQLNRLTARHSVAMIAIGNGTASRETDQFIGQWLQDEGLDLTKVVVSEAGASVYSASDVAIREYPDLDVTVRGAISIAHRLQDPLAELVKNDPKTIGVGQYQHDVNQARLKTALDREVESCVNSVGVDLNLASGSLLAHVAGIGPKLAEKIVAFRDQTGGFQTREQLRKVPKLGPKAFEQAAGFLRIRAGQEPLDNSAVHPESYYVVARMAGVLGIEPQALVGNPQQAQRLKPQDFVDDQVGLPTVRDILSELAKPGRDPRKTFAVARYAEGVNELSDLKAGMVLEGTVTNVTRFGAFVDVGVHQDGLIHISQLSQQYVADPSDVVSVGDIVRVKVLEVDLPRKRFGLSRKELQ